MPIFLDYDGVKGSVTAEGHDSYLRQDAFSFTSSGTGAHSSGGGGGAGKVSFQDLHVTTHVAREAEAPPVQEIVVTKDTAGDFPGGIFVATGDLDRDAVPLLPDLLADDAAAAVHGGMMVGMGDGSVRFVSQSIDVDVF